MYLIVLMTTLAHCEKVASPIKTYMYKDRLVSVFETLYLVWSLHAKSVAEQCSLLTSMLHDDTPGLKV